MYYWWKYAKARKLETDTSKIKNDRYRSYNANNRSVSIFNKITASNGVRVSRSGSLGSDDDTTAILMWDKSHHRDAFTAMPTLNESVSTPVSSRRRNVSESKSSSSAGGGSATTPSHRQDYATINILDDEITDIQKTV